MKVRITRQAEADLEAIAEWIGREYPARAIRYIDELLDRCRPWPSTPIAFRSIAN